jgi:hypothetical protein
LCYSFYKYSTTPFFLLGQNCSSQPPSIGGHVGGPKFSKYKGEVLIFISWKKGAKKGYFMPLMPLFVPSYSI